jgi:hypothetical protein
VAPPSYEPLVLAAPHTWLLREGWMLAARAAIGLGIDSEDRP